ncbi:MAG TPA: tetratricopeptide repeat protein [Verrucomicrobiae bacterium]
MDNNTSQSRSATRQTLFTCALLLIATAAVYWPALRFDFVNYDDRPFVQDNPWVRQGLTGASVLWAFKSLFIYWQPLTWLSYMLDYQIHHLNPAGYHLTNLLLHCANTVLLFLILNRMTGALARSAVVAALFALHPLHVETVAWVAERKGVLSAFFWMLALLAYVRYAERPRPMAYGMVVLCFALGLMSKSMVVTLPAVLLLLDFWPLRRFSLFASEAKKPARQAPADPVFPKRKVSSLLLEKVPLLALAIVSSVITVVAQKRMGAVLSTEMVPLSARISQSLVCYVAYIRKLFWPGDLAVFYPTTAQWPAWQVGLSVLILAVITLLALSEFQRRPYWIAGWLWFLGMLLPVIGLFQTGEQSMADRYSYLPLIGLFIVLAWGAADVMREAKFGLFVLRSAGIAALFACGWLTGRQLQTWKDTRSLFQQANAVTKDNYLAHTVLGRLLTDEGNYDDAIRHFALALQVQPYYASTHYGLADARVGKKEFPLAIEHYKVALRTDLGNADIHSHLAATYQVVGDLTNAAAEYVQALELQPNRAQAEFGLATVLHAQRRYFEALEHYRLALKLAPSQPIALNNAAWILATHTNSALRNGEEAVRYAERACALTGRKTPFLLGTLAAAYAEQGNFPAAIRTGEEARDTARAADEKAVAEKNVQLLELYRAGKPCREEFP